MIIDKVLAENLVGLPGTNPDQIPLLAAKFGNPDNVNDLYLTCIWSAPNGLIRWSGIDKKIVALFAACSPALIDWASSGCTDPIFRDFLFRRCEQITAGT